MSLSMRALLAAESVPSRGDPSRDRPGRPRVRRTPGRARPRRVRGGRAAGRAVLPLGTARSLSPPVIARRAASPGATPAALVRGAALSLGKAPVTLQKPAPLPRAAAFSSENAAPLPRAAAFSSGNAAPLPRATTIPRVPAPLPREEAAPPEGSRFFIWKRRSPREGSRFPREDAAALERAAPFPRETAAALVRAAGFSRVTVASPDVTATVGEEDGEVGASGATFPLDVAAPLELTACLDRRDEPDTIVAAASVERGGAPSSGAGASRGDAARNTTKPARFASGGLLVRPRGRSGLLHGWLFGLDGSVPNASSSPST